MTDATHGRARRTAQYLGLVSDDPRPKVGSRQWWRGVSLAGAAGAGSVLLFGWLDWI